MAGLVPTIHASLAYGACDQDVGARDKPGHDGVGLELSGAMHNLRSGHRDG